MFSLEKMFAFHSSNRKQLSASKSCLTLWACSQISAKSTTMEWLWVAGRALWGLRCKWANQAAPSLQRFPVSFCPSLLNRGRLNLGTALQPPTLAPHPETLALHPRPLALQPPPWALLPWRRVGLGPVKNRVSTVKAWRAGGAFEAPMLPLLFWVPSSKCRCLFRVKRGRNESQRYQPVQNSTRCSIS